MQKIRDWFNALPGTLKVIIYTGVSQALGIVLLNINNATTFDWRGVLAAGVGILINILAYLILREKGQG